MSKTRKLLRAADEIADAAALMEAAFQLADTLPADQVDPMQAVIYAAQRHLAVARAKLDRLRKERSAGGAGSVIAANSMVEADRAQVSA